MSGQLHPGKVPLAQDLPVHHIATYTLYLLLAHGVVDGPAISGDLLVHGTHAL